LTTIAPSAAGNRALALRCRVIAPRGSVGWRAVVTGVDFTASTASNADACRVLFRCGEVCPVQPPGVSSLGLRIEKRHWRWWRRR
jgi:hypothetical protein